MIDINLMAEDFDAELNADTDPNDHDDRRYCVVDRRL